MIVVKNVTKTFAAKKALDAVSFTIKEGEVVGFLGPNGAGKTTTMRLIVGLLVPTSGSVQIDSKDPVKDRLSVLSRIGYLPENNPLYPEMKVFEYLTFICSTKGARKAVLDNIAVDTGIVAVMQTKIEALSRGYKQRVGLAAALIGSPDILILDEPTSGLDPIEQEKIRTLIKKLGRKQTVLLSTHILSEVEDVATRLVIINNGTIVYDGAKPQGKGTVEALFMKRVARPI